MKYSLTERQKEMLRSIASNLENETLATEWNAGYIYGSNYLDIVPLNGTLQLSEIWKQSQKSDFDDFVDAELFRRKENDNYTINAQKIIDAVKNNFGEDENTAVVQKIEAVFGEPSSDPDFRCAIFLVMPFRPELDTVFKVLKSLATDLNIVLKRGDEFSTMQNVVINDVWSAINRCRLVIADCTAIEKTVGDTTHKEINGNVYYEIGIADALHKPVILLTQNVEDIPFDLRHRRLHTYRHASKLYDSLKPAITKMLQNIK